MYIEKLESEHLSFYLLVLAKVCVKRNPEHELKRDISHGQWWNHIQRWRSGFTPGVQTLLSSFWFHTSGTYCITNYLIVTGTSLDDMRFYLLLVFVSPSYNL